MPHEYVNSRNWTQGKNDMVCRLKYMFFFIVWGVSASLKMKICYSRLITAAYLVIEKKKRASEATYFCFFPMTRVWICSHALGDQSTPENEHDLALSACVVTPLYAG